MGAGTSPAAGAGQREHTVLSFVSAPKGSLRETVIFVISMIDMIQDEEIMPIILITGIIVQDKGMPFPRNPLDWHWSNLGNPDSDNTQEPTPLETTNISIM